MSLFIFYEKFVYKVFRIVSYVECLECSIYCLLSIVELLSIIYLMSKVV